MIMNIPEMTSTLVGKMSLASLSGLLLILIFPFFNIELLAWIAFIPLLLAIQQENLKDAFWLGWLTGVVYGLGSLYWVTNTMVRYGGMPLLLSVIVLLLLVVYLALYVGAFCFLLRFLQQYTGYPLIAVAPTLWTALEYLRSFFIIGFPWNSLGYSQFLTPSVTQIADTTGVYGVSFVIVLVNAGIYTVLLTDIPRKIKIQTTIITLVFVVLNIGYSLFVLSSSDLERNSERLRIAVVQGNIEQGIKWSKEHRQHIFDIYARLSRQTLEETPEMIVWPETAVPFIFHYDPVYKKQIVKLAQDLGVFLLFGGIDIIPDTSSPQQYNSLNSAFLLSPEGKLSGKYDKIHLVPFGEYIPFEHILFFVERITQAIGKVQPGKIYQVMQADGKPFSTVICFEIIFPNLVRKFVDKGARFLVTITNDAWFGKSSASYQHFAMVTFRAVENRVAIARAANTGISGFIDPYGRIIEQSEIFVDKTLVHDIPLRTGTTLYTRYGDLFARLCLFLSGIAIGYVILRKRPMGIH